MYGAFHFSVVFLCTSSLFLGSVFFFVAAVIFLC